MRTKFGILAVGFGLLCLSAPIAAHHSWTADYDGGKPVTVKGVVSKVEWTNPHTHFYVDVKDDKGNVTTWNFEMASTLSLERGGWSRKTLAVGTEVTIVHEWSGPDWPLLRRPAAEWVIGPVFVHGIAARTLAGIRRAVERTDV